MQNYNFFQRLLHDILANYKFINKSLLEIEKILYLNKKNFFNDNNVFITGLPRSGTTSLLNFIYSTNQFASLKYSNMPFILSPNLSKLFNKKNIKKKERLHSDGISFDLNSPEAFDEIFFNNSENFIKNELINYIKLILISENKQRYLSKNNLNYKRINLIKSIIPNSIFIIPIREPLNHAFSLLNQHLNFCKLQKKDDFVRRYMNYLGHNEFGLNHKSWNKPKNFKDLNNINYWLEQWLLYYINIQEKYKFNKNCYFIIYEELPNLNYLNKLLEKLNLINNLDLNFNFFKNRNKNKINIEFDKNIYDEALILYEKFKNNF